MPKKIGKFFESDADKKQFDNKCNFFVKKCFFLTKNVLLVMDAAH